MYSRYTWHKGRVYCSHVNSIPPFHVPLNLDSSEQVAMFDVTIMEKYASTVAIKVHIATVFARSDAALD